MRFLTRYDGEVSEPLVGRQGSRDDSEAEDVGKTRLTVRTEKATAVSNWEDAHSSVLISSVLRELNNF